MRGFRLLLAAGTLALAGCEDMQRLQPGYLGRLIDTPPPPVTVVEAGPSGVLLSGPYVPDVPDMAVDTVVAPGLREWLTFEERRSLAMASQRAAVAVTAAPVDWQSHDGGDEITATGSTVAVSDALRSLRGRICRDVRQSFEKKGEPHAQTVTLCRQPSGTGNVLWVMEPG